MPSSSLDFNTSTVTPIRSASSRRGQEAVLRVQRHTVSPHDAVLVVDDWAETGSKALTARRLVERCGGRYLGQSLLVDLLDADVRAALAPVAAVALADEVRKE
jgi:adenine/guanine phosphoribosyltransferase-like PRPP-binding protein